MVLSEVGDGDYWVVLMGFGAVVYCRLLLHLDVAGCHCYLQR
jgi:hypothetical protein